MLNFCTMFYSNYLTRGLALYESLLSHCKEFHLYILAFDKKAFDILNEMNLRHVTIISLVEFEDDKLLEVKPDREIGEYCWTCTPSLILYCIKNFELDECTYIDADLYFFSDPKILIDELGDGSVSIIEHRYTPGIKIDWVSKVIDSDEMKNTIFKRIDSEARDLLSVYYEKKGKKYTLKDNAINKVVKEKLINILFDAGHNLFSDFGKYCVQFMTFKNDDKGMKVLNTWRDDCLSWCYAKVEDNKFGDQKYLDTWLDYFDGVKSLENLGGGVAPWNVKQYEISKHDDMITGKEITTGKKFNMVFYHFAALRFFDVFYKLGNIILFRRKRMQYANEDFGKFPGTILDHIYKPYIRHLLKLKKAISKMDNSFDPNGNFKQYKFFENIFLKEKKRV